MNDKIATFAYAVHYILLWIKPLKASIEVNSEFTVISDDRVPSRTPTWGCILVNKKEMAFIGTNVNFWRI